MFKYTMFIAYNVLNLDCKSMGIPGQYIYYYGIDKAI